MANPFLLTALVYLVVAAVVAADAALTSAALVPWTGGLPWLRVHFITVGVVTQLAFGALPRLQANRLGRAAPAVRWDTWLALNAGLALLVAGIPARYGPLILAGGVLVWVAVALLIGQLWQLGQGAGRAPRPGDAFYVAGLGFLILGAIVGTGLWLGWGPALHIATPKEVHIHANLWGFTSLMLTGLLLDTVPRLTGRPLVAGRSVSAVFWALTLGATGLVIGPWLGVLAITGASLAAFAVATIWLAVHLARALRGAGLTRSPGGAHLLSAYVWVFAPAAAAPVVLLGAWPAITPFVEATAPQTLVFGWPLQFAFAFLPLFAARWLTPDAPPRLGGTWLTVGAVNLANACLWASMFSETYRAPLLGVGYLLLALSLAAGAWQMRRLVAPGPRDAAAA